MTSIVRQRGILRCIFAREHALRRSGCGVVVFGHLRPDPLLRHQLARGLEVVLVERQEPVYAIDYIELLMGVEASVADHLTHDIPVLLFDVCRVVFLVGTAPGK